MKKSKTKQGIETRAIHAGQQPDPTTGAIMTPIYATSTYVQESPGVHKGFEYSRTHNPTRFALEDCVADLENGEKGFAFASGLACMGTLLELLDSGDHVIAIDDLYGGSYRLFEKVRKRTAGLECSFIDLSDSTLLESEIRENTRMIWVESPFPLGSTTHRPWFRHHHAQCDQIPQRALRCDWRNSCDCSGKRGIERTTGIPAKRGWVGAQSF